MTELLRESTENIFESLRLCTEYKVNVLHTERSIVVIFKRAVFKIFFTGKLLCRKLFFNKVASLRPANLLKKRIRHRYFPVNIAKFLKIAFLQNTARRLLLYIKRSHEMKDDRSYERSTYEHLCPHWVVRKFLKSVYFQKYSYSIEIFLQECFYTIPVL